MDKTILIKRVREKESQDLWREEDRKKSWDEMVNEDTKKRGLCINDAQDRDKWRDAAAEEWSTPVNWEEYILPSRQSGEEEEKAFNHSATVAMCCYKHVSI